MSIASVNSSTQIIGAEYVVTAFWTSYLLAVTLVRRSSHVLSECRFCTSLPDCTSVLLKRLPGCKRNAKPQCCFPVTLKWRATSGMEYSRLSSRINHKGWRTVFSQTAIHSLDIHTPWTVINIFWLFGDRSLCSPSWSWTHYALKSDLELIFWFPFLSAGITG